MDSTAGTVKAGWPARAGNASYDRGGKLPYGGQKLTGAHSMLGKEINNGIQLGRGDSKAEPNQVRFTSQQKP